MTEHEIQRMVVRLIGDGQSYFTMLNKAAKETEVTKNLVQRYASQVESFGEGLHKFGKSAVGVGKTMSKAITAPLTVLNGLAIKSGADFESGFAGVRKTVDATEQEFAMLRQGFRDMATNEVPVAVESLLRIGEAAGQLGIKTNAILEFTKTIAMLDVATNLGEDGAESMAKFANIIGMGQNQFQNLGSAIVALGNNLPTTERDIMNMSMRLAGMGKTLGFSVPEVTGLAAALSSVGLEAEMGGSAISTFMLDMASGVAAGSKDMQKMAEVAGMTAAEFQAAFRKDALGALMSLLRGLNKLDGEAKIVALRSMGVDGIRMSDALQRASGAVDLMQSSLTLSNKAFHENTALAKEAGERFKTFWSQVEFLKNNLKDLAVDAFDLMRPALDALLKSMRDGIDWVRGWSDESKVMAINAMKLAAVLGPLTIAVGSLVMFFGNLVIVGSAVASALAAITFPAWAVAAAIAAIGVAVLAVLGWLIGSEGLANAFNILVARAQNFVAAAIGFFQNFSQNIKIIADWFLANWQTIFTDLGTILGVLIANMIANWGVMVAAIARVLTVLAGWVAGLFKRMFTVDFISAVIEGIKMAASLFTQFFTKLGAGLFNALRGKGFSFEEFISKLEGDFKKGAENINPLAAIQDVITQEMGNIQSPLAGLTGLETPALPQLNFGDIGAIPQNELANQSVVSALADPLQASLQPGSEKMQVVDNLKNQAKEKTAATLESIDANIKDLLTVSRQRLADPMVEFSAAGLRE